MIGPWSDPKRGIWVPLYVVSLVLLSLRPVGWPVLSMWLGWRCLKRGSGRTFLLAPVSTLTQREAIPLLLAEAGRQTVVYASLVWVHEHHLGKSHHMVVLKCGLLWGQPSSPSFHADQVYLLFGSPLEQWIDFSCGNGTWLANVLSSNNLCRQTFSRAVIMPRWVLACAILSLWGMLLWLLWRSMGLLYCIDGFANTHWSSSRPQWHSMYNRSPLGVRFPCLNWPWGVPSIAQCHHLEWHKSACTELQTEQLHHSHHLLVHVEHIGIYNQWVNQLSHLSSSWHLPALRLSWHLPANRPYNTRRYLIIQGTVQVVKGCPSIISVCRISGHAVIHGSIPFLAKDGEKVVPPHLTWSGRSSSKMWIEAWTFEILAFDLVYSNHRYLSSHRSTYWSLKNNSRTRGRSWWCRHCVCRYKATIMRKWDAGRKLAINSWTVNKIDCKLAQHLLEGVSYAGVHLHWHQCHGDITAWW